MKIAVAIPHLNNITPQTYQSLGILLQMKEYQFDFHEVIDSSIARSRNTLVQLSKDVPKMLWIDSDNYFTKEQIIKLLSYNHSIIGAAYQAQGDVPGFVVGGNWGSIKGMSKALPMTTTGLRKVDFLGMGCCLMKTDIFKKLQAPYFYHEIINGKIASEDISFFLKCERAGIPLYLDFDLKIGHVMRTKPKTNIIERINISLKKSGATK